MEQKKSCLYTERNLQPPNPHMIRPSPHAQPNGGEGTANLPLPDFNNKPIPWPCPPGACPCEDDPSEELMQLNKKSSHVSVPVADSFEVPECDGISLALVSDTTASGVYVAKEQSLIYAGKEEVFTSKQTIQIKMAYTRNAETEFMTYFINNNQVTDQIPFTTDNLSQGTKLFPKLTFAAATGSTCQVKHEISEMWIEMEKVLSCREVELLQNEMSFETDLLMFNSLSVNKSLREMQENQVQSQMFSPVKLSLVLVISALALSVTLFVWKEEIKHRVNNYTPLESY